MASMAYDGAKKRQYVIVLRHGLRQDEFDGLWVQTAERPWDPPLAKQGLDDVWRNARLLSQYAVEKVVSSPFLRCLQTAAIMCTSLGISTVEVDNSLSEVLGPTYFAGTGGPAEGQSVEDWLWSGEAPEAAWRHGLGSDKITATSSGREFAAPPESLSAAHARYTEAIETAANRADGQNLLIVTHGEAVGKSVTRLLPWVTVYSVQHCGFTVAWRELDDDSEWGMWELEAMEEGQLKGVFWRTRGDTQSSQS